MSTWFNLYVHGAQPQVCSREGRVWLQLPVDGSPLMAPNTVTLMLRSCADAKALGQALILHATREEPPEATPPDEFPAETLASA